MSSFLNGPVLAGCKVNFISCPAEGRGTWWGGGGVLCTAGGSWPLLFSPPPPATSSQDGEGGRVEGVAGGVGGSSLDMISHSVLICIKLPMNLFFVWRLPIMILMRGKDINWAIWRVGPWKSRFFWAQIALASLELFQGPKKSQLSLSNPSRGTPIMSLPRIITINRGCSFFLAETYLSHVSESCWFVNCHVSRAG